MALLVENDVEGSLDDYGDGNGDWFTGLKSSRCRLSGTGDGGLVDRE